MTTKEELLESAEKGLTPQEFVQFHILVEKDDFFSIRIIAEENLEKSKKALFDNALLDYCDPVVVSHFKMSDDFFNKAFDYVLNNIEVIE